MSIIVKKFGGTSIGTIEQIERLAAKLVKEKRQDDRLVIVVSAMAKTTDYLYSLASEISKNPYRRELDMLATAGERISMSLLSIALHKYGASAISFTGSQSGIITDNCHGNASIINVSAFRIKEELSKNKIVIVAGYQGVSLSKEITTLGRGGSDTTAVALAGYLSADSCQINTDVEGVYTADPNKVSKARKLTEIDYETMLFLSRSGCKVIHPRAIEFALKYNIELEIRSSFTDAPGTKLKRIEKMEEKEILAITGRDNLSCFDISIDNTQLSNLFSVLKMNHPEILEYAVPDGKLFRVLIKGEDEEFFVNLLHDSGIKADGINRELSSITFTGLRLCNDMSCLEFIMNSLEKRKMEIFWLSRNHLGFTIYLRTSESQELIRFFHKQLIEEKREGC